MQAAPSFSSLPSVQKLRALAPNAGGERPSPTGAVARRRQSCLLCSLIPSLSRHNHRFCWAGFSSRPQLLQTLRQQLVRPQSHPPRTDLGGVHAAVVRKIPFCLGHLNPVLQNVAFLDDATTPTRDCGIVL